MALTLRQKNLLKRFIPRSLLTRYQRMHLFDYRLSFIEQEMKNRWLAERLPAKSQKEALFHHEFKVSSQTGEDGIIDYIFKQIGTTNKTFIEIGVEDGRECNTANLSRNFGWKGVLVEADPLYAAQAQEYYAGRPVHVVPSFVTRENVNEIIKKTGIRGSIDLLSIDIDGNDYWIWDAVNVVQPRVVVVEYNSILGKEPLTVKYDPRFERLKAHASGFYYGTSLAALEKLARSKGYILVGCCSSGFNAFFVRAKDAKKKFKPLSSAEADYVPNGDVETRRRFNLIKHMPLIRV